MAERKKVKTHGNIADTAPLLKALKLLQAHEVAELVERAHAPVAGLLDTHNFDWLEDSGDTARAKTARDGARRYMQDFRELVRLERAVWLPFQSVSDGGGSAPKERTKENEMTRTLQRSNHVDQCGSYRPLSRSQSRNRAWSTRGWGLFWLVHRQGDSP